jgi:alkanesulfonate monooxygenase SsuD/methylene tetrahydromethanopterin reductase-like flavin-dependent oxidoreductase (luciferase family)
MAIRISVELSHVCPIGDILKHTTVLESKGFYRVWVPDTVVSPWEAWLAAGLIVHNTERVRIGLGVTNPYTRHPLVAAQMAVTMQTVSQGRLALSLGKGIPRLLEKAGVTQHDTAVEECINIVRGLMAGERVSFRGQAFQIDAIQLRTIPPETTVPIYLAAIGPPSWETALRVADGIATFWSERVGELRQQMMAERTIPTAALIPFSLSLDDFFPQRVSTLDELERRVKNLEDDGFDEVIVGYGDLNDLSAAAELMD